MKLFKILALMLLGVVVGGFVMGSLRYGVWNFLSFAITHTNPIVLERERKEISARLGTKNLCQAVETCIFSQSNPFSECTSIEDIGVDDRSDPGGIKSRIVYRVYAEDHGIGKIIHAEGMVEEGPGSKGNRCMYRCDFDLNGDKYTEELREVEFEDAYHTYDCLL